MTPEEKYPLVLAFLEDVIKKDDARTSGTWTSGMLSEYHMVYDGKYTRHIARLNGIEEAGANASFIAGSSVWTKPMAQALRGALIDLNSLALSHPLQPDNLPRLAVNSILSQFPDEILKHG